MQNRIIHLFWAGAFSTSPMILLIGVFLSIIFEFLVEFSHAKSCTTHYARVCSWSISLQISHPEYHDRRFRLLGPCARKKMTEWRTPIEILFEIRTSELIAGNRYFALENPSFSHKNTEIFSGASPLNPANASGKRLRRSWLASAQICFYLPSRTQICFSIRWPPPPTPGGVYPPAQGNMIQEILRF